MTGLIRLEPAHAGLASALHATSFAAPWSEADFAQLLAQPGVAGLLWRADAPQGFILIRAVADEAEILTIAVAPEYRRQGAAIALLDEACRWLQAGGTQRLFLEVAADNTAAVTLYTRYGFVRSGRRTGYYARGPGQAPVDALVMSLDMNPHDLSESASTAPHH